MINGNFFKYERLDSNRKITYFFKGDNGYFVRSADVGGFFGTFERFIAKVKKIYAGTKYEREYLAAAEFAKIILEIA